MAKGAKKKKGVQVDAKCLCSATKIYAVGDEAPSGSMDELALQSRSVMEGQIVTIGKSRATFKPIGKEKMIPKVLYKDIVEVRQFNADLKICMVRAEKKKTGRLLMLNFSSEDECEKFVSLVKSKNSKVMVSRSRTQSEQIVPNTPTAQRESNDTMALPLPPSPVLIHQSSPVSLKQQSLKLNIADNPSDHSKLASVPSTQLKSHADLQHLHNTGIPKIETVTATSAWNVLFISQGTSPLSIAINQQQTSQAQKETLISQGTKMVNQREKPFSSSPRLSVTAHQHKLKSENQMNQRHSSKSSSSGSPSTLSLRRRRKSTPRSCENHKNVRQLFSSSSFGSGDVRHQKHSALRSRKVLVYKRTSSTSSNSSPNECVRQNKAKSGDHGRRVHKVTLSRENAYSSGDVKREDSKFVVDRSTNEKFQGNGKASKENQGQLGNKRDVRSSSVDLSSFSLMRISASRSSVTSLYSFGILNPFSTSILSHRLASSASDQSRSSSSISTSSRRSNESGTSFARSSVSETTQRTRSLHSSYHGRHYKRLRDPPRQVTRVR